MSQQWDHFPRRELKCRCCGEVHMDHAFMVLFVQFREEMGFPFPLSRAFSCPKHNADISSTRSFTGPHTTGKAADTVISGERAARFIRGALGYGFMGIGIRQHGPHHKRLVHLDTIARPCQTIWTYDQDN